MRSELCTFFTHARLYFGVNKLEENYETSMSGKYLERENAHAKINSLVDVEINFKHMDTIFEHIETIFADGFWVHRDRFSVPKRRVFSQNDL